MLNDAQNTRVRWPAERFYWAVLDTAILPAANRRRPSAAHLGFLFENVVPVPGAVEELAMAFARVDRSRWMACGIEKETLKAEVPASAVTLAPAALPDFLLKEIDVDPASLNVLRGEHTPAPVRRTRRRAMSAALVGVLLCAVLLVVGMERRSAHARQMTAAAIEQRERIAREVAGDTGLQRAELSLLAELRQLRQQAGIARGNGIGCASRELVNLIEHWPQSLANHESRPRLISVTPQSALVQARLRNMADANRFASAFESPHAPHAPHASWQAGPPNIRSASEGGAFDVSVTLTRSARTGGRP